MNAPSLAVFAQRVTHSAWFQNSIVALILISGVISGVETYFGPAGGTSAARDLLLIIQDAILWIFVAEIFLKLAACGTHPWRYFAVGWNVFDFLIVAVCLLPFDNQFATVFRMARLVRVLRLITILPRLQLLVGALLRSIPSLGYIGILLGLHFYIYAVTGTFLFRENDPIRFGSLHTSFLTLFEVLTLEGWNEVLHTEYLGSDSAYDDAWKDQTSGIRRSYGQPLTAAAYFVSFIMLGTMIMLNLFTGVIIASMEEASNEAEQSARQRLAPPSEITTLPDELAVVSQQLTDIAAAVQLLQDRAGRQPFYETENGERPSEALVKQ